MLLAQQAASQEAQLAGAASASELQQLAAGLAAMRGRLDELQAFIGAAPDATGPAGALTGPQPLGEQLQVGGWGGRRACSGRAGGR